MEGFGHKRFALQISATPPRSVTFVIWAPSLRTADVNGGISLRFTTLLRSFAKENTSRFSSFRSLRQTLRIFRLSEKRRFGSRRSSYEKGQTKRSDLFHGSFLQPSPNLFCDKKLKRLVFWRFDRHAWQRRWDFAQAAKPPHYAHTTVSIYRRVQATILPTAISFTTAHMLS